MYVLIAFLMAFSADIQAGMGASILLESDPKYFPGKLPTDTAFLFISPYN